MVSTRKMLAELIRPYSIYGRRSLDHVSGRNPSSRGSEISEGTCSVLGGNTTADICSWERSNVDKNPIVGHLWLHEKVVVSLPLKPCSLCGGGAPTMDSDSVASKIGIRVHS